VREGRLLILDDDPMVGQLMAYIAEDMGLATRLTAAASDFFAALDEWSPTHISLDLMMPDMDGAEVMRQLAGRGCAARIIISSGAGSVVLDAAMNAALLQGLDIAGVLSKPFLPATLRALLSFRGKE
jgi:DNA-binding response OmpR family regulator